MNPLFKLLPLGFAVVASLSADEPSRSAPSWFPKGKVAWSMDFGDNQSPILLSNTNIYVHSPLDNGLLQKLECGSTAPLWSMNTSTKPLATLNGVGSKIFLVNEEFELTCLDDANGRTLWTYKLESVSSGGAYLGNVMAVRSAIRTVNQVGDTVLVGTFGMKLLKGRTGKLYALDSETGKLKWSFEAEDGVETDPIEREGVLYFGGVSAAYALDLKTGAQIWKASLRSDNHWAFILKDGLIIVSSGHYASQGSMSGGTLYALDAKTGQQRWTFNISGPSRVQIDQGLVVGLEWGSFGGSRLTALKLETGAKVWEYKEKSAVSPVVKDGRVVYLTKDNRIHILELATGKVIKIIEAAADFGMSSLTPWARYFPPLLLENEVIVPSWSKKSGETIFERVDVASTSVIERYTQQGRVTSIQRLPGRLALYLYVGERHYRAMVVE